MDWNFVQRQIQILADGGMERLDLVLQQISDLIDSAYLKLEPVSEAERRRYALLQAAATMRPASVRISLDVRNDWVQSLVSDAETLLAEIERREQDRVLTAKGQSL